MIHVCYGTQAELIKLAPVLRELAGRGTPHRIIDTGQHPRQTQSLAEQFSLRPPDARLWEGGGVASSFDALRWASSIVAGTLFFHRRLRETTFAPGPGVCVIHGDTLSTLLGAWVARRMGLKVAHVESGLRSFRRLHPFPEELIRVRVNLRADLLFAPGAWACDNLRRMNVRGRIVQLPVNTGKDAGDYILSLGQAKPPRQGPYALVSIHRFETVTSAARTRRAVEVVCQAANHWPVVWPMHEVTRRAVEKAGLMETLRQAGVDVTDILPYTQFLPALRHATAVIADGGSIQEESWFYDIPCLLLREATERREGLGENVVLSQWKPQLIADFFAAPQQYRRRSELPAQSSSALIVDELVALQARLDGHE